MSCGRSASVRWFAAGALASAALLLTSPAGADDGDTPTSGGAGAAPVAAAGLGSRVAGPMLVPTNPLRIDRRVDSAVRAVDRRVAVPSTMQGGPVPQQAVPYRVEPKDADGRPPNPWDLPPEVPDGRDFEQLETFDELQTTQYELREEIWSNIEDLVSTTGYSRYGGIGYVPFWARNTIRLGRFSISPFAHVEGVWHSGFGGGEDDEEPAFEVLTSVGALGEYWFNGGRNKLRVSGRADYHWYSDVYDNAYTYVGGAALESRVARDVTVEVGGEAERARRAYDLDTTLGPDENLFQRETVFGSVLWDRFLASSLRLGVGGSYTWVDEVDSTVNGGDYTEWEAHARLDMAIMRHEGFAYGEYRYEKRDADGVSSDLDHANEIRVGVDGILPHARTRRLVGNAYVGYRWETYTASTEPGSVGAGRDTEAELMTLGADLTYRPTPYTSGFLSFQRSNGFSAVSNYNTVDTVTLAVTQNLSHRLVARLAGAWSRIEPEGSSDSQRLSVGVGVRWVMTDNVDFTADYEYAYRFAGAGYDQADAHRVGVGATFHLR